jgi:macrodomain Ter protein organizer (MatP/YcbG family)
MALTTIKVPVELRDRISHDAKQRGMTAAALLGELLDDAERNKQMAAVGASFAMVEDDDEYWEEVRAWDLIASGLPRE